MHPTHTHTLGLAGLDAAEGPHEASEHISEGVSAKLCALLHMHFALCFACPRLADLCALSACICVAAACEGAR